jgi:hypothetical protein
MASSADRFDPDRVDRLLETTEQVRERMDLERPVLTRRGAAAGCVAP